MRKVLLAVFLIFVFVSSAAAGSWSLHCTNASCVAEQGALKVYWMASGDIYFGKLTGIEGIPIAIDDYQAIEKNIESMIKKTITRKKGTDTGVEADAPEGMGGPTAGTIGSKENLFTKKRSMAQSKTMGKKVSVDYTLAFVEWLGDTRYGNYRGIKKYWAAAEHALDAYKNGNIEELIEMFFIARNAAEIDNVAVDIKMSGENKDIVLTKYIGLTKFPAVEDIKQRYALASWYVYDLSTNNYMAEQATKITEEFKKDLNTLKLLVAPNQTAEKLYKKDKDAAFAKWLADNGKFVPVIDRMQLKDKYLVAISIMRRLKDNLLSPKDVEFFTAERNNFEAAIKNKDKSVKIVTIKGSPLPVIPIAIIAGLGLLVGVVIFMKRRKKNK